MESTSQDFLSKDSLKILGFTEILDTAEANSDICTDLFPDHKTIVKPSDVKDRMKEVNANLKSHFGIINDTFVILDKLIADLNALFNDFAEGNENIKARVLFYQVFFQDIEKNKDPCLVALANVQRGLLCYAASGKASEHISVKDDDLVINVLKSSTNDLDSCTRIFTGLCEVNGGTAIFDLGSDSQDTTVVTTNKEALRRCDIYRKRSNCDIEQVANCEDASAAIAQAFTVLDDYSFYPNEENLKEISDNLNSQIDLLRVFLATGGKLDEMSTRKQPSGLSAQSGNAEIEVLVGDESDGGANLQEHGHKSGVDFKNSVITSIVSIALIALGLFR